MTPYSTPLPAPSKRLVLFVADGLRADKFFEVNYAGESNSPYLRDIITNIGAWGVSHTRVPTESRPGHVALIGGIYEDVSAVTKGWKENPVEFDSVFNESRYTWAWGSPDILPMFSKGSRKNVFIDTYTSDEEDFAGAKPHSLDIWVFDKLEKFLNDARTNATLKNMLWQDKNILFLHLLGMDISGHSYKPGSQEYIKNIQVVDTGIQKCVDLIDSFFEGDGKTAYVLTSDHGMTDWGSHGSGDMQETYTPLVAWGAGVRGPLGEGKDFYHDGLSAEWKLAQVKRVDVNQVDIAPLISALIGIPFPVNSLIQVGLKIIELALKGLTYYQKHDRIALSSECSIHVLCILLVACSVMDVGLFGVISFFKREILSVILWAVAAWPFLSNLTSTNKRLCLSWCITSVILSAFPMMAVVGKDTNYNIVILAGWLFVFAVGFCARRPETGIIFNNRIAKREPYHIAVLTAVQVILLCICTYTIQSTSQNIANKDGLPFLNQIVSWFILGISLIFPLFGSQSILTRLLNVMTSLFAPYLLLSISHEGMFCLLLCLQMLLWLVLEHQLSYNYSKIQDLYFVPNPLDLTKKKTNTEISLGDFRRAYFFIFFILLAFFGTGNIASINSFNPTSVYCFLTVFNPFVMGFLMLIKSSSNSFSFNSLRLRAKTALLDVINIGYYIRPA
ncbi:GPI ethanolamine phosphate transferase 1 [Trichonephila clavipes]|nr:GPI ethanolamine phosphate transferase 1 [Trichonephila clavipes]